MPGKLPPFFIRLRFATSMIATWLLNLNMFGFSLKSICSPGLNCHGCPWATFACPIGVMTYGSALHTIPVLAIATVLAIAAVLGRLVCSFLCPFGLLQDLLHKLPGPKIKLPRFFRYGKYAALLLLVIVLPYWVGFAQDGFLVVRKPEVNKGQLTDITVKVTVQNMGQAPVNSPQVVWSFKESGTGKELARQTQAFPDVVVPPGESVALPVFSVPNYLAMADLVIEPPATEVPQHPRYQLYYCKLCPAGTLTATVPSYFKAQLTKPWYRRVLNDWLRVSILVVFLGLMVLASRPYCRLFCPLGAIYGLTARLSLSRMSLNQDACIQCGQCDKVCPMSLDVRKEVGGAECIACGDCKKVCPGQGIERGFGL